MVTVAHAREAAFHRSCRYRAERGALGQHLVTSAEGLGVGTFPKGYRLRAGRQSIEGVG